jgi:hypothetical protein
LQLRAEELMKRLGIGGERHGHTLQTTVGVERRQFRC